MSSVYRDPGFIGTLPRTTDGVPFAIGKVYSPGSLEGKPHIFEHEARARWIEADKPYIAYSWGEEIKLAYSSREACQRARMEPL